MEKTIRSLLTRKVFSGIYRYSHKSSTFSIENKVALITGGGSGLGLYFAKALLKNGLKGVTLADVSDEKGQKALEDIKSDFGENKAVFIKTDVIQQKEVEAAFEKTIGTYNNLDIVINNAGVLNDSIWERQIAININGTIYGCLLALDYLPKHRSGDEGVIVNLSSITGLTSFMSIPIYSATKHAIVGLSKGLGVEVHYNRSRVRVVTICPGVTDTAMISDFLPNFCLPAWEPAFHDDLPKWPKQTPDHVANGLIQAITTGTNGSFWVVNDSKIQYIQQLPDVM